MGEGESKMAKPKKPAVAEDVGADPMTAAMAAMNPVATSAWLDLVDEGARFFTQRLEQDLETQRELLACKNPAELIEVQSRFMKSAMEQYSEEAKRLLQMMSNATEEIAEDASADHSRSQDDVPV